MCSHNNFSWSRRRRAEHFGARVAVLAALAAMAFIAAIVVIIR